MPEISFNCPECQKEIKCDSSYVGQKAECPHCLKGIVIPLEESIVLIPAQTIIKTDCPNCETEYVVQKTAFGQKATCPLCKMQFIVKATNKVPEMQLKKTTTNKKKKERVLYYLLWLLFGGVGAHCIYAEDYLNAVFKGALTIVSVIIAICSPELRDLRFEGPIVMAGILMFANFIWLLIDLLHPTKDHKFDWFYCQSNFPLEHGINGGCGSFSATAAKQMCINLLCNANG